MTDSNPHYVTPEEADHKLCPMGKRVMTEEWEYWCDGPKCMAWRWQGLPVIKDGALQFEPHYSATHGYCGMVRND